MFVVYIQIKAKFCIRIRIRKFTPREPIIEKEQIENLESDDSVEIQQDDLYAIAWASDFGDHVFESKKNLIQDHETIQIIPEPSDENKHASTTDEPTPQSPEIFPAEGEDVPADTSDNKKEKYDLRPSTHPYYSDKYR